jgi:predicted transcriptional regulator of viral defense system
MRPADALGDLLRTGRSIMDTGEVAVRLGVSTSHASHILDSLQEAGLVLRLRRGLWAIRPDIDPFVVPPYLTAPFPAYISLWSALAHHGMIEQVPRSIYVASPGRTRRIHTGFGTYSIHHIAPELFDGFEGSNEQGYLAIPEKAVFDTVYLLAPRGGEIRLPELELPKGFRLEKIEVWTSRIEPPRLRTIVTRGLDRALALPSVNVGA